VFAFFSDLKDRFYRIAGIIHGTLPRDLGYHFMATGTVLERAENVARLLDVKYHFLLPCVEDVGGPVDLLQWQAVLRSASALEAYRRVYGNAIAVDRVLELLVFDSTFPRSVRFAIDRLRGALARVAAGAEAKPGRACPQITDELSRQLRTATAAEVIRGGLHDFLLHVQDECGSIGSSVFDRYLRFE
jgi:uncharacterized alpha-E superfamily protein